MMRWPSTLSVLLVMALTVGVALRPDFASDPHNNDFTAYWAAGRLNLQGRDPYDAPNLLEVERAIGWQQASPRMLWNPPWILGPLMVFGAMDFPTARNLWLVAQLALTLGSALALWRYFRGPDRYEGVAVFVALLFAPLILSMKYGQIGPLCLAGLTGFLVCERRRWDALAGAMLGLAAMKPHLVYLVWPAVLVWSVSTRRWKVLLGLAVAGFALAALPLATNPPVYANYLAMANKPPPPELAGLFITQQDSPTFGWQLRKLVHNGPFALQYVPTALGFLWLAWYGGRHRTTWNWDERMPVLLLVSLCTAAYGAWPADSLLLLPAVMAAAATLARTQDRTAIVLDGGAFLALTFATFAIERQATTEAYVWVRPLYLLAYLHAISSSSSSPPR